MLTPDELVDRAHAIAPQIAASARDSELRRKPDDEIIRQLREAGIFRILAPKRWGGLEYGLDLQLQLVRIISTACMSTGWISCFYSGHNVFVSRFSEQAQADVYANGPDIQVPATNSSLLDTRAVAGGYEISGRASWATGIMHADWALVSGMTEEGVLCFLVPASDLGYDDVWHMSGMSATGSNDIVIEKAFVPAHRALPLEALLGGGTEGGALHESPIYSMPLMPFIYSEISGVFAGGLRGALDAFEGIMNNRVTTHGRSATRERSNAHVQLGAAAAASMVADELARSIVAQASAGAAGGFDLELRLGMKAKTGFLVDHCRRAVNEMINRSGAAAFRTDMPLQRFFRDLNTLALHAFWDWESAYEQLGRSRVGLEPSSPLV